MNHIYKSVWNEHTGAYVAVSEKTKTKGKRSGSILFKTVAAGILGFCITGGVANAQSNPNINNVANLSTTAALSPVMGIVGGLTGSQGATATNLLGGVLDPVLGVVGGLTGGQGAGAGLGGLLDPVLGLVGGLGGATGATGTGVITDVQGTVGTLVNNTVLSPVGSLANGLIDPQTGALAPVTGLVDNLTSPSGALAPVGGLVNGLVGQQGALTPVVATVNGLLSGVTGGLTGGAQGGPLDPVLGLLGGLTGGNGGLLGGGSAGDGVITDVQGTVGRLVNNTALAPVGGLVNGLVDPQTGALAPVTGLVNDLTSANGPLAPVGGLVNTLVGDQGALTPVVGTVNNLLSGLTGGLTGGGQGGGLLGGLLGGSTGNPGTGAAASGGLLGGLLGGGQSGGLLGGGSAGDGVITDVQGTVGRLVNNTALTPVGGLINGLVDPQTGALAPVTGLVNDLTSANGPLAPVGGLVNTLLGDQGALTPVIGTVNNLLSGLTGGLTGGGQGGGLLGGLLGGSTGNPGTGAAASGGLLGGLLGGGQSGGQSGGLLGGLLGGGQGGGLLGGLLGGGQGGGLLGGLLGGGAQGGSGNVLDLATGITLPQNQLGNTLDGVLTPLLTPVEGLLNSLLGALAPVVDPVVGVVNGITAPLGIELPTGLHLDLVEDLSLALQGKQPLDLALLAKDGNILGLTPTAGTTPNPGTGGFVPGTGNVAIGGGVLDIGTAADGAAEATGSNSIAIGNEAKASGNGSVVLGAGAEAKALNTVALGAGSVADEDYTVSVGSSVAGSEIKRRITNVEAGKNDTDAVNVAQLKGVDTKVTNVDNRVTDLTINIEDGKIGLVQQANKGQSDPITVGKGTDGTEVNFTGTEGNRRLTGVAAGTGTTDAVNVGQLQSALTALGGGAKVEIDGSITGPTYNFTDNTIHKTVGGALSNLDGRVTTVNNAVTNLYNQVNEGKIGLVQQAAPNAAITVGKSTGGNEVNFRNESGEARRLTGVAEAVDGTDAVNLDQVTRMVQGATPADLTEVRNDISSLRGDVRRVEKRADAGAATAMAVAGLPQAYLPGKSMVSMAGGVYASESGYAIGASTVTENGKWVLKGSVAGSSRGQMGATVGAGYQW
ncbi:MAG: YadA-like family protein [Advenella sp.]|nr:YadA-like family protein [Advenella sp.]